MFCKWCGGSLTSSDTKCKRCGKEIPALSDCGGFYDLVPNAKNKSEVQPEPIMPQERLVNPLSKPEPPKEVVPTRSKKSVKKLLLGLRIIAAVGFAVVVLLLIVFILGKVNQYSSEVNGLRNDLLAINEKLDSLQAAMEPVETEPTIPEPAATIEPALEEQDVIFKVMINSEDSSKKIDADLTLGDYSDTAIVTYGFGEMTGMVNSVDYTLKEADAAVSLVIDYSNVSRTQSILVSYVIDDVSYGPSEAPETCKWQYRFDATSEWKDLPEDAFIQNDNAGKTGLAIKETALKKLIDDNEGQFELRCEIYRANTSDGSLTIVIEGIRFYTETDDEIQAVG